MHVCPQPFWFQASFCGWESLCKHHEWCRLCKVWLDLAQPHGFISPSEASAVRLSVVAWEFQEAKGGVKKNSTDTNVRSKGPLIAWIRKCAKINAKRRGRLSDDRWFRTWKGPAGLALDTTAAERVWAAKKKWKGGVSQDVTSLIATTELGKMLFSWAAPYVAVERLREFSDEQTKKFLEAPKIDENAIAKWWEVNRMRPRARSQICMLHL